MGIRQAVGGFFLRQWIVRKLGKDWFDSWTVNGIILILAGAGGAADAICGDQLLPGDICSQIDHWLTVAGQILTVLGIRRAARGDG